MKYWFVDYINRSGSTLFSQLAHKSVDVCACPENEPLARLILSRTKLSGGQANSINRRIAHLIRYDTEWELWGPVWRKTGFKFQAGCTLPQFLKLLDEYRRLHKPNASQVVFKGGSLLRYLLNGTLGQRRPDCDIVALVRDGRAVFASQRRSITNRTNRPMQVSPIQCAKRWQQYIDAVASSERKHQLHVVRYEDLLDAPTKTLTALGLYSRDGNDLSDTAEIVLPVAKSHRHLHRRVHQSVSSERAQAWKEELDLEDIALFESIAEPGLMRHDYSLYANRVNPMAYWKRRLYWAVRWSEHALAGLCKRKFRRFQIDVLHRRA